MKLGYSRIFVLSGIIVLPASIQAEPLHAYPFTKSQFDGGFAFLASQNSGGRAIAARTLTITQALKDHLGSFQIDLAATFDRYDGISTIQATNVSTASFYVASSASSYFADSAYGSGVELFKLNISSFVDAYRTPLQTYSTVGGTKFLPTIDLGLSGDTSPSPILAFTTLTNFDQSSKLRNWISTLSVGTIAIIGLSFDLNVNDGKMSLVSTEEYLGNNVAAYGTIFTSPDESLGFELTPIFEPKPTLTIMIASTSAQLLMENLSPGHPYRVMESDTLAGWTQLHAFTAPPSSPPALPINSVSYLWATPIHPSGRRFFRLEWNE